MQWKESCFNLKISYYLEISQIFKLCVAMLCSIVVKIFVDTVSILSVGVRLEGEIRFFDTNRKDRNCMLNVLNIKKLFILVLLKLVAKHGAIHI